MNEHTRIKINEAIFNKREKQNEKVKENEMYILQTCSIQNNKDVD
jgi:hypothetical protein